MTNLLLDGALYYARKGLKVFPLTPLSKIPIKGTQGSKDATTDITTINKWWTDTPQANIGLVTERFLGLDIDTHNEENNGYKSLEILENSFDKLPDTYIVATANDGLHLYFKKPDGLNLPQKINLVKGIDVKAHPNNYVVAPPSVIKRDDGSEGRYTIKNKTKLADCPQWLIEFILRDEPKQSSQSLTGDSKVTNRYRSKTTILLERLVTGIETGSRNNTIASITGQLLAYGMKIPLAWELIQFMNSNSPDPLEQKELETTFLSICKKELRGT